MNEYNKEVESRFIGNPLTGFIEDLRNYALHYQLPFTAGRYRPADGDAALRFILHSEQLQEWSNWSPKGSPFLDLYPKEIVVRNLAADYFKEIEAFQHWLFTRIEQIHQDELAWLKDATERVQVALGKIPTEPPDTSDS